MRKLRTFFLSAHSSPGDERESIAKVHKAHSPSHPLLACCAGAKSRGKFMRNGERQKNNFTVDCKKGCVCPLGTRTAVRHTHVKWTSWWPAHNVASRYKSSLRWCMHQQNTLLFICSENFLKTARSGFIHGCWWDFAAAFTAAGYLSHFNDVKLPRNCTPLSTICRENSLRAVLVSSWSKWKIAATFFLKIRSTNWVIKSCAFFTIEVL